MTLAAPLLATPSKITSASQSPSPAQDAGAAFQTAQGPALQVEHALDETGASYEREAGVVLAKLPEGASASELSEQLAKQETLASPLVTPQDIEAGWATLPLREGASPEDAISQLLESGLVLGAQPNYVYRLDQKITATRKTTANTATEQKSTSASTTVEKPTPTPVTTPTPTPTPSKPSTPTTDISKASITLGKSTYTYDGKSKKPQVTVRLDGTTVQPSSYSVAYANNVNAGTAKVTITGKGTYRGMLTKTFTIKKASVKKLKLSKKRYKYNGKKRSPKVSVKGSNGLKLKKNRDFKLKVPSGRKKVGTYKYVARGKGNYTGKATAKFKIYRRR